jgi:hypothetical protein
MAGWIWDSYGGTVLFVASSLFAIVLAAALFVMRERFSHTSESFS